MYAVLFLNKIYNKNNFLNFFIKKKGIYVNIISCFMEPTTPVIGASPVNYR